MIKYESRPEGFFPFIFCAFCKKRIENLDAVAGYSEDEAVVFAHNDCEDNKHFGYAVDLITFFANLMHNTGVTVAAVRAERKNNPFLASADRKAQTAQTEEK
jgi:hypothetical protein